MGVVKEKIRISVFNWEHEKIALKHKKRHHVSFFRDYAQEARAHHTLAHVNNIALGHQAFRGILYPLPKLAEE